MPETIQQPEGGAAVRSSDLLAGGETWNKCDVCGRFISMIDFDSGKAVRRMTTPDSDYSTEDYETLCRQHRAS
jgi:hypothetical protein